MAFVPVSDFIDYVPERGLTAARLNQLRDNAQEQSPSIGQITPESFGCLGDSHPTLGGGTDDSANMQAAIDYATLRNMHLVLDPTKYYRIHDQGSGLGGGLQQSNASSRGCAIGGPADGGGTHSQSGGFVYTGTSGCLLQLRNVEGFKVRDMAFYTIDPAFEDVLVYVDGASTPQSDPQSEWEIFNCSFSGGASNPIALLGFQGAINGEVHHCAFGGGQYNLLYGIGASGHGYCNIINTRQCTFNQCDIDKAHIGIMSGDMEQCTIGWNTFEGRAAIHGLSGHQMWRSNIIYNWVGDIGSGNALTIFKNLNDVNSTKCLLGWNFVYDAGSDGTIVSFNDVGDLVASGQWVIIGNSFGGGAVGIQGPSGNNNMRLFRAFNSWGTDVVWDGTKPNHEVRMAESHGPNTDWENLTYGGHMYIADDLTDFTESVGSMFVGAHNADAAITIPSNNPMVYGRGRDIAIQPGSNTDTNDGHLAAGITPTDSLTWRKNMIGFLGKAAVARPATYTLNAGTKARTLPVGATALQIEACLRQVITDLGDTSGFGLLDDTT